MPAHPFKFTNSVGAVTIGSSADGITIDLQRINYAIISVEDNDIRYWLDGSDPTSTEGHLVKAGESFHVWGPSNVKKLRMISVGPDATVQISVGEYDYSAS